MNDRIKFQQIHTGDYCNDMSLLFNCKKNNGVPGWIINEKKYETIFSDLLKEANTILCFYDKIEWYDFLKELPGFIGEDRDKDLIIHPKRIEENSKICTLFFNVRDFNQLENFKLALHKKGISLEMYSTIKEDSIFISNFINVD